MPVLIVDLLKPVEIEEQHADFPAELFDILDGLPNLHLGIAAIGDAGQQVFVCKLLEFSRSTFDAPVGPPSIEGHYSPRDCAGFVESWPDLRVNPNSFAIL